MCRTTLSSPTLPDTSSVSMTVDGCSCEDCQQSGSYDCTVRWGDIVTVDLEMAPENGLVPEPLFDRNGVITFVVGWGNYLPALHEMVQGKRAGESFENISIDAGWGDRNPELVVELPKSKLQRFLQPDGSLPEVGTVLKLSGAIQLSVLTVNEEREIAVVDANPPLAGSSYECSMKSIVCQQMQSNKAVIKNTSLVQLDTVLPRLPLDVSGVESWLLCVFQAWLEQGLDTLRAR